ncbi:hypothetical protein EMMF5_002426 [Cystobasidiomycetes sp. EMM_F5]
MDELEELGVEVEVYKDEDVVVLLLADDLLVGIGKVEVIGGRTEGVDDDDDEETFVDEEEEVKDADVVLSGSVVIVDSGVMVVRLAVVDVAEDVDDMFAVEVMVITIVETLLGVDEEAVVVFAGRSDDEVKVDEGGVVDVDVFKTGETTTTEVTIAVIEMLRARELQNVNEGVHHV